MGSLQRETVIWGYSRCNRLLQHCAEHSSLHLLFPPFFCLWCCSFQNCAHQDQTRGGAALISHDQDASTDTGLPVSGAGGGGIAVPKAAVQHPAQVASAAPSAAAQQQLACDRQQPKDVAPPPGFSAFAASAGSLPAFSTSVGSDAGGSTCARQPRGVEAMLGGQRRSQSGALTSPTGVLASPSGAALPGGLLVERAASSSSAHRALLGGSSPTDRSAMPSPAATSSALLELPEQAVRSRASLSVDVGGPSSPAAADGTGAAAAPAAAPQAAAAAQPAGASGRPAVARPTVVIPPVPAYCSPITQPMSSPAPLGSPAQPYVGPVYAVDELDLDVIDDIAGVDACGLSTSSSPTIGGPNHTRSIPGAHLRSSRDHDLRRAALLNMQLLSPSLQPAGTPHIMANNSSGGGEVVSITPDGAQPAMFTGSTRARALAGSNTSLQLEQGTDSAAADVAHPLQLLRLSRGSTPSSAPNSSSPARPRSGLMAASPRGPLQAGSVGSGGSNTASPLARAPLPPGSRASSAAASPVPPPSHGPAAALLAGSVLASPRTPHSPLSVVLSPGLHSARVLSGPGTPLPGPLFGSGFGLAPPGNGLSPMTSPGTSSLAASASIVSSCGTAPSAAGVPASQQPGAAGQPPNGAAAGRRLTTPLPNTADGDAQQQQQGEASHAQPTQMQQLLRQQVMQHDTRFGPHGGSPLSPSHHQQQHVQLPPRGDALLSPSCPTPLVPPALMPAGSRNGHLAHEATAAAAGSVPAGTGAAGRQAGGVGQGLSIHEWLDHQSWRLPYDVPQGLRDAADVRDAAAQEHAQSRLVPAPRGLSSSRSSSQRDTTSNLDSPQAQLPASGACSGMGRPSVVLEGAAAGCSLPVLQGLPVQQQQRQHGHHRQSAEGHLQHREVQAASHHAEGDCSCSHGRPDSTAPPSLGHHGRAASSLDTGAAWLGQVSSSQSGLSTGQLSVRALGPDTMLWGRVDQGVQPPSPSAEQEAARWRCLWQPLPQQVQQQAPAGALAHQQQQQHSARSSSVGSGRTASYGGRGLSHLSSSCVQSAAGAPVDSAASVSSQVGASSGEAAAHASSPSEVGDAQCGLQPMDSGRQAAGAAMSTHMLATGGRQVSNSDTCDVMASGAHVVQLGVGSHLYPAGSPVRQGSCCFSCQQPGDTPPEASGLPAVAAEVGAGVLPLSHISSSHAGGARGAADAYRCRHAAMQEAAWHQLPSPMSPGRALSEAPMGTAGAVRWQQPHQLQARQDEHVLPGIAELMQRRHEVRTTPQQLTADSILPDAARRRASLATQDDPASPHVAARASAGCGAAAVGVLGGTGGNSSDVLGCCSHGFEAGSAGGCCGASSTAAGSLISSSSSSSSSVLAALLHNAKFMGRLLSALPGVDPDSPFIKHTVAELQEALSRKAATASQQGMQLH